MMLRKNGWQQTLGFVTRSQKVLVGHVLSVILKDLKFGKTMNVSKTPQNQREKLDFDDPMTHLTLL